MTMTPSAGGTTRPDEQAGSGGATAGATVGEYGVDDDGGEDSDAGCGHTLVASLASLRSARLSNRLRFDHG